jgi:transcriptional regulator with XRE-family HTH domain
MEKISIGKTLATNLAKLMARCADLNTQTKVAKKAGIGQTTVGRILRNEVSASAENIAAIAYVFGISVDNLLSPNQTEIESWQPVNSRKEALFSLFDALPENEQEELIYTLEKKKQYYDRRVKELLAEREGSEEHQPKATPTDICITGHIDDPFPSIRRKSEIKKVG